MSKMLIVASRNAHKVEEISAMLPDREVGDLSLLPEAPEVKESGATFKENATLKALAISRLTEHWVLADDSGLEVDALDGAPGVRSARYAGQHGNDAANNGKLLRELSGVNFAKRGARFRCAMVLARQGEVMGHFTGTVEGRILEEESGAGGFGYDPLFMPEGHEASFACLGAELKNAVSHRARALGRVRDYFEGRNGSD